MARPYVFQTETTLYHPSEGARVFPAGETDPGPAWTDSRGGEPADKGTTKQAMRDLIAAQDQIDGLGAQLVSRDHDLAVMASTRDEASLKVAGLEQRAIDAEKGQETEAQRAAEYMRERDAARADHQRVGDQVTAANARVAELEATVTRVTADLGTANQIVADQNDEITTLKAEIAKFDGDKDGRIGGKPAAKPATASDKT